MSKFTDQTNDAGYAVLRVMLDQFPSMRGLTKEAELDTQEFTALPDKAFAWPGKRQFPVHTREHAILSYGYSKHASSLPSDVSATLQTAIESYGVDTTLFDTPIPMSKVATEKTWLLPDQQRFLIKEAQDIPYAEQALHARYTELNIDDRAVALRNLVKVAESHNVKLSPATHKLGSVTLTSTRLLRDYLGARRSVAIKLGSAIADAYREFESGLVHQDAYLAEPKKQIKIARTLVKLDKASGVDAYYHNGIPDPLRSVFNTEKRASSQVNLNGEFFDKEMLAGLPLTFWQDAIGEDVVTEIAPDGNVDVEKLVLVLNTLPQDVKTVLVTQLKPYQQ